MFCSSSITLHLLRGAGAVALLACAAWVFRSHPVWALLPLAGALLLMRGCPMCWLMGLAETVARRSNPKAPDQGGRR